MYIVCMLTRIDLAVTQLLSLTSVLALAYPSLFYCQ